MNEQKSFTLSIRTPNAKFLIDSDQVDKLTDQTRLSLQFFPDIPISSFDQKKNEYELTFRMTARVTADTNSSRPLLEGPCMQDVGVPRELMMMGPEDWIGDALLQAMDYMAIGIWEVSKLRGIKQPPFAIHHVKNNIEGYFIAHYKTYFPDYEPL